MKDLIFEVDDYFGESYMKKYQVDLANYVDRVRGVRNKEVLGCYEADAVRCYVICGGFFLRTRERINESYPELFGGDAEGSEFSARGQFSRKWNWYTSLFRIADGDITKYATIAKLNIHECLYYLAYKNDLDKLEAQEIKNNFK